MNSTLSISSGDYLVTIRGRAEHVRVVETQMIPSLPGKTILKAHWVGTTRAPWRVDELVECGAKFTRLS